jgi:hypothetical protein
VTGATRIGLLGSATNAAGPGATGTVTVGYADGTSQQATVTFADWTLGGGSDRPPASDTTVASMPYRDVVTGATQPVGTYVFATDVPVDPARTIDRITLPDPFSGTLHVFAIGYAGGIGPIGSAAGRDLCVDDSGSGTAPGNRIQVWGCNGTAAQQWTVAPDGSLRVLGGCLAVAGGGTAPGTPVRYGACDGTAAQRWRSGPNGSLVNPATALCLDDPFGSTAPGTALWIATCNGGPAQRWTLP